MNDDIKTFWQHLSGRRRLGFEKVPAARISIENGTLNGEFHLLLLKEVADINFPTHWGDFRLLAFEGVDSSKRLHKTETLLALTLGDLHAEPPLVRIHSQCTTGDVFHSLRCDCHDQLHLALQLIGEQGAGVLVYEHQEGRGIGLIEKLRAYQLQDEGLDTVEANLELGHAVDLRDYALSVEVLRCLQIHAVQLITNNPEKINAVRASGIEIVRRVSADVPGNPHSALYLTTKRTKLGHLSNAAPEFSAITNHRARQRSST